MRGVSEGMFLCGVLTNNETELCQVLLLSMLQLTMDTEEPLLTQNIDQQYIDDDMIRVVIVCRLIGINVSQMQIVYCGSVRALPNCGCDMIDEDTVNS